MATDQPIATWQKCAHWQVTLGPPRAGRILHESRSLASASHLAQPPRLTTPPVATSSGAMNAGASRSSTERQSCSLAPARATRRRSRRPRPRAAARAPSGSRFRGSSRAARRPRPPDRAPHAQSSRSRACSSAGAFAIESSNTCAPSLSSPFRTDFAIGRLLRPAVKVPRAAIGPGRAASALEDVVEPGGIDGAVEPGVELGGAGPPHTVFASAVEREAAPRE